MASSDQQYGLVRGRKLAQGFCDSEFSTISPSYPSTHNLTNAKPNLGDIGHIGYAQFNRAGEVIPQVATLQPLTVLLQYKYNFRARR